MNRSASDRVSDIIEAIDRCRRYRSHLNTRDPELAAMAYDAILRNLAVIGEAVRTLPDETTSAIPGVPWASIAGLRNVVVHEYFRIDTDMIIDVVDDHLGRACCCPAGSTGLKLTGQRCEWVVPARFID